MKTNFKRFFNKNGGLIFAIIAAGGVIATSIFTAIAAPKAKKRLAEAEESKGEPLTTIEKITVATPSYLVPASICAATIATIIAGSIFDRTRQAKLIGAYALLSESFHKYKSKVVDIYGKEGHNKVIQEMAIEKAQNLPSTALRNNCINLVDDEEKRLFLDCYSGTMFESSYSAVLQAQYELNRFMMSDGGRFVPLSMWYELLGLRDPILNSFAIGWMVCDSYQWIDFENSIHPLEDGLECVFIQFVDDPETEEILGYFY